jgi:microsomal dipeptidase-like Zn-dependent dipeptidase
MNECGGDRQQLRGRRHPDPRAHARRAAFFFATPERYVEGLKEMADVVGVDHVSVGTDAGATGGLFAKYDGYVALVDVMLRGGFSAADTAKIIGGNYLRIFAVST